jgi:ArsR family transcriptional regulator
VRTKAKNPQANSRREAVNSSGSDVSERSMLRRAEEIAVLFKMLGNINRLRILLYLAARERTVSDIETALQIRQPTLSQQLGELRDAELIVRRRVAKSAIYALTSDRGQRALQAIYATNNANASAPRLLDPHARTKHRTQPAAVFAAVFSPSGGIGHAGLLNTPYTQE